MSRLFFFLKEILMARLASQEKAGFYPIPPTITDLIRSHISAPHGGRVLDPCCGTGIALVTLAEMLRLEAYGVERKPWSC